MWGPAPRSARWLRVRVLGIPLDGAIGQALGTLKSKGWGTVEELLAGLVEQVDATNRLLYRINSKRGTSQPKPIKVPRPDPDPRQTDPVARGPKKKRPATSEELRAFFGGAVRYTGPSLDPVAPETPETP